MFSSEKHDRRVCDMSRVHVWPSVCERVCVRSCVTFLPFHTWTRLNISFFPARVAKLPFEKPMRLDAALHQPTWLQFTICPIYGHCFVSNAACKLRDTNHMTMHTPSLQTSTVDPESYTAFLVLNVCVRCNESTGSSVQILITPKGHRSPLCDVMSYRKDLSFCIDAYSLWRS